MVMVVAASVLAGCGSTDAHRDMVIQDPADAAVDVATDVAIDAVTDAPSVGGDALSDSGAIGGVCNPLTQAGCSSGEKCTWVIDTLTPQYSGRVACAPSGTAQLGDACMFGAPGATGYDNCSVGLVCGNYRGDSGTCKTICDQQGGTPLCGSGRACVTYQGLFATSQFGPQAAGVCDVACDPLADNDFDGSGSMTKGSGCGSSPTAGCYGSPSYGTPPVTAWTCTNDINYDTAQPLGLRHRVICSEANNCADPGPTRYLNSCNQGHLPILYESTGSTSIICVAMCKPLTCYAGNCGVNAANRGGAAPHRCNASDRVGSFTATEHCQFLWWREVDDSGNLLPSPTSDTVGFCFDMSKYRYDSNGDNKADSSDQMLPNCDLLQAGFGSGSNRADPLTFFGAADLGCVPSPMPAIGKPRIPRGHLGVTTRPLYRAIRTQ